MAFSGIDNFCQYAKTAFNVRSIYLPVGIQTIDTLCQYLKIDFDTERFITQPGVSEHSEALVG